MIDTTIWRPLSDFLIETEEYHKEIFAMEEKGIGKL